MRHDIIITSADQPTIDTLTTTLEHCGLNLAILHSPDQATTQVTNPDGQIILTLTLNSARLVKVDQEPARLVPDALPAPCWWTEAWTTNDPTTGIQILNDFAIRLNGRCHILGDLQ